MEYSYLDYLIGGFLLISFIFMIFKMGHCSKCGFFAIKRTVLAFSHGGTKKYKDTYLRCPYCKHDEKIKTKEITPFL